MTPLQRHGVEFTLTHHEAAAAYMADTEGQLTGRPGVCVSTLGPGAANLFAGLAQATLERSPVLGLAADVTPREAVGQRHQVFNIPGAFAPAVKYSARVSPDNVGTVVPAAWSAATQGMPRRGSPVRTKLGRDTAGGVNRPPHPKMARRLRPSSRSSSQKSKRGWPKPESRWLSSAWKPARWQSPDTSLG